MIVYFFFFKQKTAYEMRISDWSSDVCSSDLIAGDKSQSQPRAFTARQGAHLLNRAVAGKAETTQLCPHRARRRALHLANHMLKGRVVGIQFLHLILGEISHGHF